MQMKVYNYEQIIFEIVQLCRTANLYGFGFGLCVNCILVY